MRLPALKITGILAAAGLLWGIAYRPLRMLLADWFPGSDAGIILFFVFLVISCSIVFVAARWMFHSEASLHAPYRQFFSEHPVPMWVYEWGSLRFLAVNEAAVKKYGYSQEEFASMTLHDIRDPATIPELMEDVKRTDTTISYRGIWQHRRRNGETFYVELHSRPTLFQGKQARIVMALDIDAEVRQMIEARDISSRYDLLAQVTPDYVYYYDIKQNRIARNHGPVTLFGYRDAEVGDTVEWWQERVHPEDLPSVMQQFDITCTLCKDRLEANYRFRCADGHYKYVYDRGYIIYNEQRQPIRVIGVMQDVDESTRQKQEIELLSLVASRTANSVIILDARGRIEWVNEGFRTMTGYLQDEANGKLVKELLSGPDTDPATVLQIEDQMARAVSFSIEILNYKKNGAHYWVKSDVTPILNAHGELQQYILIQTDITERRTFMQRLQENNDTLHEIARINSHEIRKPVSSILGIMSMFDLEKNEPGLNNRLLAMLRECSTELDATLHKIQDKLRQTNHR
ncbi:PAS domain-containing protein [Chitinophaga sp. NPDC101104]|uniref:PAS domain-containing protein n=1 Tax=Chitinophaga sp. NPDC101104 TaxID=3390561 RepID=UPI003D030890